MDLRQRKMHEIQQRLRYLRAAAPPPGSLSASTRKSPSLVIQKDTYNPRKVSIIASPSNKQSQNLPTVPKVERSPSLEIYAAVDSTKVPTTVQSQASKSTNPSRIESENAEGVQLPPIVFELSQRGLLPLASKRKSSMNLRREVEAKLFLGSNV